MSWGFSEGQDALARDEATYDGVFTAPGVTFVASTGDYGAAHPEYPAFSPNVLSVGGTSLRLNADSTYNSETGFGYQSSAQGSFIGGGGGISLYEPEPAYQLSVQSTGSRTIPDVSLVADPVTGAWAADTYNSSGSNPFVIVGGTSLSAPCWAGLVVLADQGRAAAGKPALESASSSPTGTQQALYSLPQRDYNAITSGYNGYSAGPGYNLVTGLGSPVASSLLSDLVAYQGPGTSYSGAPVGPIQSGELVNTLVNADTSTSVQNVFDSFTLSGSDTGSTGALSASKPARTPLSPQGLGESVQSLKIAIIPTGDVLRIVVGVPPAPRVAPLPFSPGSGATFQDLAITDGNTFLNLMSTASTPRAQLPAESPAVVRTHPGRAPLSPRVQALDPGAVDALIRKRWSTLSTWIAERPGQAIKSFLNPGAARVRLNLNEERRTSPAAMTDRPE
jgi:hypothetical protein